MPELCCHPCLKNSVLVPAAEARKPGSQCPQPPGPRGGSALFGPPWEATGRECGFDERLEDPSLRPMLDPTRDHAGSNAQCLTVQPECPVVHVLDRQPPPRPPTWCVSSRFQEPRSRAGPSACLRPCGPALPFSCSWCFFPSPHPAPCKEPSPPSLHPKQVSGPLCAFPTQAWVTENQSFSPEEPPHSQR